MDIYAYIPIYGYVYYILLCTVYKIYYMDYITLFIFLNLADKVILIDITYVCYYII